MPYTPTTWVDRAVATPNKYTKSGETSTEVTLVQAPGTITQAGTPLNAANLNKLELAVQDAAADADQANADLTTHAALTNPHSATSAATASRLMLRDANGRVKVAAPSAADDVARLDTVRNFGGYFITPQTPVSVGMGGTIVPKLNTQVTVGNSTYFLGTVSGTWKVLRFDWSSKTWTQLASTPANTGTPDSGSNGTYNAMDNVIYFVNYGSANYYVLKYDIAGNTCTTLYTQASSSNIDFPGGVSYYGGKILFLYPGTSTSPYTYYNTYWRILDTSGVSQANGVNQPSLGTSSVPYVPVCNEYQGALLMGVVTYSPYPMYKIVMDATLNTVTVSTVGTHGSSWHTQVGGGLFVVTKDALNVPGTIRDMNNSVVAIFPPGRLIDYNFISNPQNTTEFELWQFAADGSVYRVLLNRTYT